MANFSDYSGDFVLEFGDREIRSKLWSLPDYPGELTALPISLPNGLALNCVDDLALLSQSANGLQKALCTLSKFCNNWMKTKIVIFQKKCKKSTTLKHQFYINNESIEITNSYPYLGVKFSTNGSFKELKAIPKVKAKRAIFATRQHLNFLRLPIDISSRLLNSLYLPILMYGSKVWSIYDKDDHNSRENDIIEKTQIQLCRQLIDKF